ncbi:hypothetical protein L873DRAFT_1811198 [Choiromyces venosus 120613-1]|uniref:Uncharacterized protein n=1 Tax=Choiromyces venosus 120613-1 TaxID=1336337 RepID=A0A3N4JJJ1_9PEZI|nr:hypothetical protein L873DRAFT_1811198 [Choiromyces venosus 120613-1]
MSAWDFSKRAIAKHPATPTRAASLTLYIPRYPHKLRITKLPSPPFKLPAPHNFTIT